MNTIPIKFTVKKLGAIKDSSFGLSPFMIFSGESGLGKSYTAFLTHYFYLLLTSNRLNNFFEDNGYDYDSLIAGKKNKGVLFKLTMKKLYEWINQDLVSYIGYLIGNKEFAAEVEIEFNIREEELVFEFEEELVGINNQEDYYFKIILGKWQYRIPDQSVHWGGKPFSELLKYVLQEKIFGKVKFSTTFLMPPSRGALVGLTLSSQGKIIASAGMYEEFLNNLESLEQPGIRGKRKNEYTETLLSKIAQINNGELQQVDNKLIYSTNGISMPVSAAASSVKELTPLTLFLQEESVNTTSVLFEEPEAHLHPQKQIQVAELIATIIQTGAHFQVTTHSDYFIRRINDLIILHHLKGKLPKEEFELLCKELHYDKDSALDPQLVGAYFLERTEDGSVRIIEQDIKQGIPYNTFYKVLTQDVRNSQTLKAKLKQLEHESE